MIRKERFLVICKMKRNVEKGREVGKRREGILSGHDE
jgi:hypothetical protein